MPTDQSGAPSYETRSFYCPLCGAFAHHAWLSPTWRNDYGQQVGEQEIVKAAQCVSCSHRTLWRNGVMVYPTDSTAPLIHPDMPENVVELLNEARAICDLSPRGAAALLRLSVQVLVEELLRQAGQQPRKELAQDIGKLVELGLPIQISDALDGLRVIGNNLVHPGQIVFEDEPATVIALFKTLNIIVERTITEQKHLKEINDLIPAGAREAIEKRNEVAMKQRALPKSPSE